MTVRRQIAYLNERVWEAYLMKREARFADGARRAQDGKNVARILFARYEIRFTSDAWSLK